MMMQAMQLAEDPLKGGAIYCSHWPQLYRLGQSLVYYNYDLAKVNNYQYHVFLVVVFP